MTPEKGWFFPWPRYLSPPPGSSTGPGSFYPLGMAPEDFFRLYWRVRSVIFAASITYSGTDRGGTAVSGAFSIFGESTRSEDIGELGLSTGRITCATLQMNASDDSPSYAFGGSATFANGTDPTDAQVISSPTLGDAFYPALAFDLQFPAGTSPVALSSAWIPVYEEAGFTSESSGLSVDFLGNSIQMHRRTDVANPDTFSITGEISIVANRYWEDRGTGGANPIYDSLSGAQLITPTPQDFAL